jgi:hypothetical protein
MILRQRSTEARLQADGRQCGRVIPIVTEQEEGSVTNAFFRRFGPLFLCARQDSGCSHATSPRIFLPKNIYKLTVIQ